MSWRICEEAVGKVALLLALLLCSAGGLAGQSPGICSGSHIILVSVTDATTGVPLDGLLSARSKCYVALRGGGAQTLLRLNPEDVETFPVDGPILYCFPRQQLSLASPPDTTRWNFQGIRGPNPMDDGLTGFGGAFEYSPPSWRYQECRDGAERNRLLAQGIAVPSGWALPSLQEILRMALATPEVGGVPSGLDSIGVWLWPGDEVPFPTLELNGQLMVGTSDPTAPLRLIVWHATASALDIGLELPRGPVRLRWRRTPYDLSWQRVK